MRNRHGRINKPKKIIRNVTHEPHDQEGKLTLFWSLSKKKKKYVQQAGYEYTEGEGKRDRRRNG